MVEAADLRVAETRSGRAVWDDRGNSTWEWQTQPGVFSREIDTQQLKVLSGEQLRIEDYTPRTASRRR